ncbi:hypothetical protein QBC47DRAFT_292864 [Echria macrotheca]|uniref:F-box domain-containing protein n=1 Tax=Echria macrotheca TaxID=438768 RepID=A0AAJ0BIN6_9PEZI|nr:hypothetical protein QBC47DRAFT_292864 [Echria macrotheca]
MDRIFRWLGYLLPRYHRRLPAQEGCIFKIPTELVDMILEHLQPESVIAFALTCRQFFVKHFPKSAQLSASAKARLLQWLEQDIPSLYFCHACVCLHSWRLTVRKWGCKCVLPFRYDLTYTWARLVMNRHLYGPLHGLRAGDIEQANPRVRQAFGVTITDFWTAKIIHNNLYVHGTMVFSRGKERGNLQSLRAFIDRFRDSLVCRHLGHAMISEICRDQESSRPFRPSSGAIQSCAFCFTDYQIRVTLTDPLRQLARKWSQRKPMVGEDWSIEITRWHNLGACRSPHDLEWDNLVSRSTWRISGRREDLCGAGMVQRAWMEDDLGHTPVIETAVFSNSRHVV